MDGWLQIEEGFEEWEDILQKIFWGSGIKYYKLLLILFIFCETETLSLDV